MCIHAYIFSEYSSLMLCACAPTHALYLLARNTLGHWLGTWSRSDTGSGHIVLTRMQAMDNMTTNMGKERKMIADLKDALERLQVRAHITMSMDIWQRCACTWLNSQHAYIYIYIYIICYVASLYDRQTDTYMHKKTGDYKGGAHW